MQKPYYKPKVFTDLAVTFNVEEFRQKLSGSKLTQGYGNVWYSVDQHLDEGSWDSAKKASPALPEWAQEVQRRLLAALYWPEAYGWAAEFFWSVEAQASLGVHIDNDDVYTVQLYGRKKWLIDPVNLEWLEQLSNSGAIWREGPWEAWISSGDEPLRFTSPTTIELGPGDVLALPTFALHHVVTADDGPSLSFNTSICQEQVWTEFLAGRGKRPV